MMRKREIKRLYPLLQIIEKLDEREKKTLFQHLTHEGCSILYECVHNALHNPTISHECRKKICCDVKDYKDELRFLANTQVDKKEKKKLLSKLVKPVSTVFSYVFPILERDMKREKQHHVRKKKNTFKKRKSKEK